MKNLVLAMIASLSMVGLTSHAGAQTAEPTFKGDPDVYKIVFEDANFRVIEATRKKGARDKVHSHPAESVVYNITDCPTKLYDGSGKLVREDDSKAGMARAVPVIPAHSAENTGSGDCRQIFFEKK
jgi:hypothetical protein